MLDALYAVPVLTLWVTVGAAFLGGMVRGAAGFGGALVMVPLFAVVSLPAAAVSLVLLIECVGYVDMLRHVGHRVAWRAILPLTAAALVAVPLGVYAVTQFPAAAMTR